MSQQPQDQSDAIRQEEQTETPKEQMKTTAVPRKKNRKKEQEFEGNAEHKALKKKILDILKGEN